MVIGGKVFQSKKLNKPCWKLNRKQETIYHKTQICKVKQDIIQNNTNIKYKVIEFSLTTEDGRFPQTPALNCYHS